MQEPHDQANQQPQSQPSTQVGSDSIHRDPNKKRIYKCLETFITTFLTSFKETLKRYRDEISPGNNTTVENAVVERAAKVIGENCPGASLAAQPLAASATYCINRIHREKAKRIVEVFRYIEEKELGNMLAEAGGNIFHTYQTQFNMITDKYLGRAMEKLAIDATTRVINYVNQYEQDNPNMNVSVNLIIEGVKKGTSSQNIVETAMQNIPIMPKPGYTIEICGKKYKTSEVYESLVQLEQPEEEHKYILSLEDVIKEAKKVFKKIYQENNSQVKNSTYYNMTGLVKSFTGRDKELHCLHQKLQNGDTKLRITRMATVTGLGGIGKTELVRKYAIEYTEHYDNNIIWIDSETHESLTTSFKQLAKQLNIPTDEEIGENTQERQVNSIVEDVYNLFIDVKSLFIFDNAEEYTAIEKFLPIFLRPNAERPYILITSRNRDWDVGDAGEIHVIPLDVFTQEEATMYIENSIDIKDGLQERDVEELTKRLQYFPLALWQAITYINREDKKLSKRGSERFTISDYLKKIDKHTKLLDEGYYKSRDTYSKTVLTTWVTTLKKINEDQNHGMKAIDILSVMAYLAPDKIHASEMFDCDGVELCDKYSMIDLKEGGVASIHRLVQEVIRLSLKDENREEDVIKNALTLIGNNENICKENTSHVTSVWSYACGYSNIIKQFYFNFNSIPTYGYNNATPLHLLAENGSDKAVEAILVEAILLKEEFPEKFNEIIDAKDKYNRTPLYMAIENGHASVVKLFVDKGAKLDIKSTIVYNSLSKKEASDWTLLHVAAFNGYSDIVKILHNKDNTLVDIQDSIGRTAAVLAAISGQINVLEILKPEPYNEYLLHAMFRAARKNDNLEDLKNFLTNLEEKHQLRDIVNAKLGEWTPLHLAAFANWLDVTKILIRNGAKVKDDTPSFTPLHSASFNGHLDVIKYLIKKGAHPNDINEDGWTPLHAAAQNGHLHVVEYFIDELEEIDIDVTDNACATPLHTAAFHGKLYVVKFLLERGADIKAVNIFREPPLFIAAINNNRDFMTSC